MATMAAVAMTIGPLRLGPYETDVDSLGSWGQASLPEEELALLFDDLS